VAPEEVPTSQANGTGLTILGAQGRTAEQQNSNLGEVTQPQRPGHSSFYSSFGAVKCAVPDRCCDVPDVSVRSGWESFRPKKGKGNPREGEGVVWSGRPRVANGQVGRSQYLRGEWSDGGVRTASEERGVRSEEWHLGVRMCEPLDQSH
jgi:hypothetical protein